MNSLENWGGAECTVNRVGDRYFDQLAATGHSDRLEDFARIAGLGLDAVRFPVLWERVSPYRPSAADFSWSDPRLAQLRTDGIRPIIGLIHHGCGPGYTSLLEPSFAPGLAAHALATAQRYPWVEEWTPVNEPLTTARFSALYGHWYPHARCERLFWTAVLNQIDGTRLAMQAIRSVNTSARLIQTEDFGRTFATAALADQAAFDNTRRWMAWDLLCGMVVPGHAFWERLCAQGFETRLRAIAEDPCPPDVIGINHYLTSDRFLDHRVQRYPRETLGTNRQVEFADVAAARVLVPPVPGLDNAIRDTWERYRLPIALTEVHNGCSREEQLRWADEAWNTARRARAEGIDLQAVTTWALFGNRGWNTLLRGSGNYEAGVFDVRGPVPRETALAGQTRGRADAGTHHPAAAGAGWWLRDIRLHHLASARPAPWQEHGRAELNTPDAAAPLLITGATGTLGRAMAAACSHRGIRFVLTSRAEVDLDEPESIAVALGTYMPWAVINAAGWVRVDDAEEESQGCLAANRDGALNLVQAAGVAGIPTLSFSSDLVFGGGQASPHGEDHLPAPLGVYGMSKAEMEKGIEQTPGAHLVIRTAAFFSPYDDANFAIHVARALERGSKFQAANDQAVSPTYVPHLCNAALDLLIDGETGIWHLSNSEELSWSDFATRIANVTKLDASLIEPVAGATLGWRAPRPTSCGLISERGGVMPSLQEALQDFAEHYQPTRICVPA